MVYNTLLIDLDDTIYPYTSGIWPLIKDRINLYMHERLHMDWDIIPELRRELFVKYGTTLRGLIALYNIDQREYLDFVHDVPVKNLLTANPCLYSVLSGYAMRRVIFTNADRNHALRVLKQLGVEELIDNIVDIYEQDPYCKPMPEAYEIAIKCSGETDPCKCVMLDDSPANLASAKSLGCYTIRVGNTDPSSDYHAAIETLCDLPTVVSFDGKIIP